MINTNLRRLSLLIFIVGAAWIMFQPRPGFVVPTKLINKARQRTVRLVSRGLLIIASLLPLDIQRITSQTVTTAKTLNIQIVYDVSISMAAKDIEPSRFDAAKDAILTLIKNLDGYNLSLIAFAGQPIVQLPFSDETKAVYDAFSLTSFADFPPTPSFQGTAIGDALLVAIKNLGEAAERDDRSGIIILLTDGDANIGANPQVAIDLAQKLNIPIYTLGIGQQDVVLGKLHDNQELISSINLPLLKKISSDTGGQFYRVFTSQDFQDIFTTLENTVKAQEKKVITNNSFEVNMILLVLIICGLSFLLVIRLLGLKR